MTAIVDAGPIVALHDRRDRMHSKVVRMLQEEHGELVLPAPVSAEADYLIGNRLGARSRRAFVADLAAGRYLVECLSADDYPTVLQLDETYSELNAGLADFSIVVLANRFRTRRVFTFDERHFRALRPLQAGTFELLPVDA